MKHRVFAIILSAGRGLRMGGDIPKQYLPLGDRPVLAHTLAAFDAAPSVDALTIVSPPEDQAWIRERLLSVYPVSKPVFFTEGGRERQESVWNALQSMDGAEIVVVHDGVRPLIRTAVIEETILHARRFGAAAAGMPVKDTIKETNERGFAVHTPDRSRLWLIQTPQTFQLERLLAAHRKAREEGFLGTDDASLLERMGHPVKLVEGDYSNIKITTPEDIMMAQQLLGQRRDRA